MNAFEQQLLRAAAVEHWYDPHDDKQFTFQPNRLTRTSGVTHVVNLKYMAYDLPDKTTRFVLYELMQRSAPRLGLDHNLSTWRRLDEVAQTNEQLMKVFIQERMLPLSTCWIKQTQDRNILMAVEEAPNRLLLRTGHPLYIHMFSSDWLAESGGYLVDPVKSYNAVIGVVSDAAPVLAAWHNHTDGNGLVFHNGYYVNDVTVSEIGTGDTLQLLVDASGRGYYDIPIAQLKHYNSTRDMRGKYLIQIPTNGPEFVETPDEMDIFICNRQAPEGAYERIKGIYYSRLYESDTRMLTHQAFALDARRVEALIDAHSGEMDWSAPFLRIFMRHSTEPKKLYPAMDGNYLLDLYRTDSEHIESLILGTAGGFEGWRANALEDSPTANWQQSTSLKLSLYNLKGVYAFEELNRRVRDVVWEDSTHVLLPYGANMGGMLQLFTDGELVAIDRIPINSGFSQWPVDVAIDAVEFLPGSFVESGDGFDRDTNFYDKADWFDERFYWREFESGDVWLPAVEGTDFNIDRETGDLIWASDHSSHERMRRSLRDSIYRRFDVLPEMIYYPLDIYTETPATLIPLAKLDVYINGRKLVEGVDYRVDYPQIQIYNKQYFLYNADPNQPLRVEVFHYGVPEHPGGGCMWGFIKHRMLRDTDVKVFTHQRHTHVTVDGLLADPSDVNLYEEPNLITLTKHREGALYSVEPYPWMLGPWARKRLVDDDLERGLKASTAVYPFIEQPPTPTGPVFIPHAHAVFSPWLKRLLQRIRAGEIDIEAIGSSMTAIRLAMIPYLEELDVDIAGQLHDETWPFLDIHPTPDLEQVEITEPEFMFLRKINTEYLYGRIVFNSYVQVDKEPVP